MCKGSRQVCWVLGTLSLAFLLCSAGLGCLVSSVNKSTWHCAQVYWDTQRHLMRRVSLLPLLTAISLSLVPCSLTCSPSSWGLFISCIRVESEADTHWGVTNQRLTGKSAHWALANGPCP